MDHQGHGLALDHPIFNTPERVAFEWIEQPRPKTYVGFTSPLWPEGVPETYRLAQFEIGKPDGWNPTIVSHEGFFTDIPGFENLAEGNSDKMLGSLSLARQGRYFYWGYSIDPERMTGAAADTLVNVLHYMRSKRDAETVPFVCTTRKILWVFTVLGRETGYERGVEEHFRGQLTEEWRKTYTPTFEGAEAWVAENLPYVFSGKTAAHTSERYKTVFEVDADAKALGTPNQERASLQRWIALVEDEAADPEARARAERCLQRYVQPSIAPQPGTGWSRWYAEHQGRIAFIESTGFWWQLDPTKVPVAVGR
jgi:hypothetical protein